MLGKRNSYWRDVDKATATKSNSASSKIDKPAKPEGGSKTKNK